MENSNKTPRIVKIHGCAFGLDEDKKTAEIVRPSKIRNCRRYRIPDHVTVDGKRYVVTSVAFYAYRSAWKLKHLVIPDSIDEEFTVQCFYNDSELESVDLPSTIKEFGYETFYGCDKMKELTIRTSHVPELDNETALTLTKTCVIKVPKQLV